MVPEHSDTINVMTVALLSGFCARHDIAAADLPDLIRATKIELARRLSKARPVPKRAVVDIRQARKPTA